MQGWRETDGVRERERGKEKVREGWWASESGGLRQGDGCRKRIGATGKRSVKIEESPSPSTPMCPVSQSQPPLCYVLHLSRSPFTYDPLLFSSTVPPKGPSSPTKTSLSMYVCMYVCMYVGELVSEW